jgi:hypothetical protein
MGNNCCSSDPNNVGGAFGDQNMTGWSGVEMIAYND